MKFLGLAALAGLAYFLYWDWQYRQFHEYRP